MAHGGMYDQLGGGFHRYSTDAHWLVPHFEKMLYDNSQLARVYLHAWQALGDPDYRRITIEILDYVAARDDASCWRILFHAGRGQRRRGRQVFPVDHRRSALGFLATRRFSSVKSMASRHKATSHEQHLPPGQNILSIVAEPQQVAQKNGLSSEQNWKVILEEARRKLFEVREQRIKPGRDEKVLAAWNGLMLAAFAEAARDRSLGERTEIYRSIAEHNAEFLLREMRTPDGRLLRTWKDGQAKLNAYLEDYACVDRRSAGTVSNHLRREVVRRRA